MGVIDFQMVIETGFKVFSRTEVASFQKSTCQDAKPQLHLIEPGAMLGRKVKHMLMGRIAEERTPLCAAVQSLGGEGDRTPLGHETADIQTPMGIEIIDNPIVALHRGQLVDDVGQMGGPIRTGAGLAQIPHELSRRHHKRGQ